MTDLHTTWNVNSIFLIRPIKIDFQCVIITYWVQWKKRTDITFVVQCHSLGSGGLIVSAAWQKTAFPWAKLTNTDMEWLVLSLQLWNNSVQMPVPSLDKKDYFIKENIRYSGKLGTVIHSFIKVHVPGYVSRSRI